MLSEILLFLAVQNELASLLVVVVFVQISLFYQNGSNYDNFLYSLTSYDQVFFIIGAGHSKLQ